MIEGTSAEIRERVVNAAMDMTAFRVELYQAVGDGSRP
jgi:hypothetical protein